MVRAQYGREDMKHNIILSEAIERLNLNCNNFDCGKYAAIKDASNVISLLCHTDKQLIKPIKAKLNFSPVINTFQIQRNNFKMHGVYLLAWGASGTNIMLVDCKIGTYGNPLIQGGFNIAAWVSKYSDMKLNPNLPIFQEINQPQKNATNLNDQKVSFVEWWEQDQVMWLNNVSYSRKNIVNWMRNKDSGAHHEYNLNDPDFKKYNILKNYLNNQAEVRFLSGINSILYPGIYALVRTIAGELIQAIEYI